MYIHIEPYIFPVFLLLVLGFVGRMLIKARRNGKKNGCALGCFGLICLVLAGPIISSFLDTKPLYDSGKRRWYMHTYYVDDTLFYGIEVSPTEGLSDAAEPWYCCLGFQGGEAGWKNKPTELYLRQEQGSLFYFNFETEEIMELGNVPVDVPMYPIEKFFRKL